MDNWFIDQMDKWGLAASDWYMGHEQVAKLKKLPSFAPDKKGQGKIILVTAMSPTVAGEGKTTTAIALTDALNLLGQKTVAALRQPSVGPVFGKKGGATGGGEASVIPQDQIDLGLTGDFYSIENANNMMAALIDNHIYFQQEPTLDPEIYWARCLDMNERTLRSYTTKMKGEEYTRHFTITAASELMAILSLSKNFKELKEKIGKCVVAKKVSGELITAKELGIHKVAAALLRDAFYPNLIRTKYDSPVIMHAGPFANIAQGTNSIIATALAKELADYVVTEAGFGADLGAEKFFNIKCRQGELDIACCVIVATTRAIEKHGLENLKIHIENMQNFGANVLVCLNKFPGDTEALLNETCSNIRELGVSCEVGTGFEQGAKGTVKLAEQIIEQAVNTKINFTYAIEDSIEEKVEKVSKKIYRAQAVQWSQEAKAKLDQFANYQHLPICMAKTPLSLGDDPKEAGQPGEHTIHIRDLKLQAGAGFIVALTGSTMLLPGLPKEPRALAIDLSEQGEILW